MNRLLLTAGIMLALLAANGWQYQQVQAQTARAARAELSARDRLAKINQLQQLAANRHQAEQKLARAQRQLQARLGARELRIRELERENQQYRNWAVARLPDVTQRLRQRPALTGAGNYQQWLLSQSDPLPAASNSPDSERRPEH